MANFYSGLLGCEIVTHTEQFAKVSSASTDLLLHKIPAEFQEAVQKPPTVREDSVWKPVFEVASIEFARVIAQELGGHIKDASAEWELDGVIHCDGHDTEGNVIQVRMTVQG